MGQDLCFGRVAMKKFVDLTYLTNLVLQNRVAYSL